MTTLRSTSKTDEIDFAESDISISEEGKVIFDFVHIDGEEHTVVLPRPTADKLAEFIKTHLEDRDEA